MADQNPFSEFGGELKAKVNSDNPFSEFGGELKKKNLHLQDFRLHHYHLKISFSKD